MSTTTERCGLCGVASHFLVSSQWGRVCRLCLRGKSRKARRGASVAVPLCAEEPASTSCPTCTFEVSDDGTCAHCATTCWFCGQPRNQHEPDCMGGEVERGIRERENALREEGRRQGLREATEAAVRLLRDMARREDEGAGRHHTDSGASRRVGRRDVLVEALRTIERGEHLRDEEG